MTLRTIRGLCESLNDILEAVSTSLHACCLMRRRGIPLANLREAVCEHQRHNSLTSDTLHMTPDFQKSS